MNVESLKAVDRWENHWFPIAEAALARCFPAVHAALFLNLAQTSGPEVILSVQIFVDRLDALSSGVSACGAEGVEAAKLLTKRGLTADVLREARDLLAELRKVAEFEGQASADQKVEPAKVEEALWCLVPRLEQDGAGCDQAAIAAAAIGFSSGARELGGGGGGRGDRRRGG